VVPIRRSVLKINPGIIMVGQMAAHAFLYYPSLLGHGY
jgi:hypothetical protein